ncbi:MAG: hypothetical protein E6K98_06140 [Thaumarchaeota archaeon]|nr:MAG: hypothetical protein E6K98_06140 [Nitrososphaerota archaeon]
MANIKIVAVFAIIIVAAIAGVAWPFFANLQGINVIPIRASLWHVGKGSQYEPEMIYQVSFNKTSFSADMKFLPTNEKNQGLLIEIKPSNSSQVITQRVQIGLVYDFTDISPEAKPYFDILDQTVFSMRDYATEDKYLAKGAEWGDLYIGANHEKLAVTDVGKNSFGFGTANSYMLSYRIGVNINKFWVVDNLPLPVKAEVYDPDGNLEYTYELVSLKAPLTPGLS